MTDFNQKGINKGEKVCPDCMAHYIGKHLCDGLMKMLTQSYKNKKQKGKKIVLTLSSHKDILGGSWCIEGTRIPLARVAWVLDNEGIDQLCEVYPQIKFYEKANR